MALTFKATKFMTWHFVMNSIVFHCFDARTYPEFLLKRGRESNPGEVFDENKGKLQIINIAYTYAFDLSTKLKVLRSCLSNICCTILLDNAVDYSMYGTV